ncbi:MAG: sigma-70 family RNA polymerase sigma factor [Bacteroidia bacterium]|nr:sigma-70 family RNA polymerase sigma factor [Bacteroidia bacterium]
MNRFDENEIIDQIRNLDNKTIALFYSSYYPKVKKLVKSYSRYEIQADDVFQESLTKLIMNLKAEKFMKKSSLGTYFLSICRFTTLNMIRTKKPESDISKFQIPDIVESNSYEQIQLLRSVKSKMNRNCIEILDLRFSENSVSLEEIAREIDISYDNARQRFARCLKRLKAELISHPLYNEYFC